jgi:hypothetical protein
MLGVAALPLTTYAAPTLSNDVEVTINANCGLIINTNTAGGGIYATQTGPGYAYLGANQTNSVISATIAAGAMISATTHTGSEAANTVLFNRAQVSCNNTDGYILTVGAVGSANMVGADTAHALNAADWSVTVPTAGATEGYAWYLTPAGGSAGWTTPTTTAITIGNTTGPSAATGDDYWVNYGVNTMTTTPSDTYVSNMRFTLTLQP